MRIGIDIRSLMSAERTGIGEYSFELLNALFLLDKDNEYWLFYNSHQDVSKYIPRWAQENVHFTATKYPNKLFNAGLCLFGRPRLDELVALKHENIKALNHQNIKALKQEDEKARLCHPERSPKGEVEATHGWPPDRVGSLGLSHKTRGFHPTGDHPKGDFAEPVLSRDEVLRMTIEQFNNLTIKQSGAVDVFFSPNLNFTAVSPRTKFILTVHDLSFEFFPDCFSAKQRIWHKLINPRKQCRRADLILTPSDNTRRDLVKEYGIDEKKVKRIYPGLSPLFNNDETDTRAVAGERGKYILYLGTIEPRKNVVGIIEAFKEADLAAAGYELIIAGAKGWGWKAVEKLINKTVGVKYVGFVSPEEKVGLYKRASLFVYPSFYEGFGFPVLEAMASSVPVITSNRSALPEVAGNGAYLVNPYNVSEIASGMKLLLGNDALAESYREKGMEQAKKFRWEAAAEEFLRLIKE